MTDRADMTDERRLDKRPQALGATDRRELQRMRDECEQMRLELQAARAELKRRDLELESLRAEFGIVRVLSEKLRISIRGSTGDRPQASSWAKSLKELLSFWRSLLRGDNRGRQEKAIRASGTFDADWYLKQYPDVAEAGYDPLRHYLSFGAGEGRDPHPLFDSRWYRSTYPEVERQKLTALGHFVCIGERKGYDPNPLFHTAWYVGQNPDVIAEGVGPLCHYMRHASEPGRNPNPLFDSTWYLNENPDVREAGENPLCHYLRCGIAELRDPHPLFDTEWYLEQYKYVDMDGMDALEHYLTIGAFEGCRPGPERAGEPVTPARRTRSRPNVASTWLERRSGSRLDGAISDADPPALPSPIDVMRRQMRLEGQKRRVPRFTGEIGVFVHLFYESLAEEIASSLLAIPFDFKVYVSTNDRAKKAHIEAAFRRFGIEPVVKILPNRGWDVAPFVLGFVEEMRNHDLCLKLHGKRSRHSADVFGARWRAYLLAGLLGDRRNVLRIVDSFVANPELGVLMLPHWRGIARRVNVIGANYQALQALLGLADMSISSNQPIEFPSGSMFWFRGKALAPLLDLGLTWFHFQGCRPRSVDATIAHAIERSVLIFAAKAGFKWAIVPRRWTLRNWVMTGPRKWVKPRRALTRVAPTHAKYP
jgi:hypothetical protein